MENRLPGADVNPYLALTAMIAAGLHGIDNELQLEPPFEGNAYESDKPHVPHTLYAARDLFAGVGDRARRLRPGGRGPLPEPRADRARGLRGRRHRLGEVPRLRAAVSRPVDRHLRGRWRRCSWRRVGDAVANCSPRAYTRRGPARRRAGRCSCRPTTPWPSRPTRCSTCSTGSCSPAGPTSTRAPTAPSRIPRPRDLAGARPLRAGARAPRARAGLPVLGICRGMELLNVALRRNARAAPPDASARPAPPHAGRVRRPRGAARARLARGRAVGGRRATRGAARTTTRESASSAREWSSRGWSEPDGADRGDRAARPALRARRALAPGGGRAQRRWSARSWRPRGRRWAATDDPRSSSRPRPRCWPRSPRAGAEETDAAVARAERGLPRLAGRDAAGPLAPAAPPGRRARGASWTSWRRSRRATPASRSPTRAARWAWWSTPSATTPAAPERLLGDTIPVAGGVDMTFREPLGVVGLITPWNFPLTIASWKVAPGAGGRQHGRPEARGADAADRARAGADRPRGGAARRAW